MITRTRPGTIPLVSLALIALALPLSASATPDRARQILDKVDDLWRGASSRARMEMQVKTEHYERTLAMEVWSQGKEKTLVRILAPRREKDTATLKAGNEIYTYLPRTNRVIRLTSGMMAGAWMGSHFNNDDLVRESRLADDYDASLTFEGERDGAKIVEVTLIPKKSAAVVWGKVVTEVRAADFIPTRQRYFDEDGKLARTMTFTDIRDMGGRKVAARMRIVPADKPKEFTELRYAELEFGVAIDDLFFSIQRLKRR